MLTHDYNRMHSIMPVLLVLTGFFILAMSPSCSKNGKTNTDTEADSGDNPYDRDYFHADNDIAMVVRSLADAIKVGEPLDSTEYDFEGVLTDGQGAPLYTDVQGGPGVWVVDVLDNKNVTIRNLYLGDLLPGDLENYLLHTLGLSVENKLDFTAHEAVDDDETDIVVYDLGGGYLRFEVRAGLASNGLEGPLLTIIMSSEPPAGVEMRKAV